jgi:excisionase family DNA binding protein
MATKHNSPKPFSVAYGCAQLGISVPTFYGLVNSGRLRTYKIGRARRVSDQAISDCIKLLESETAQGPAS